MLTFVTWRWQPRFKNYRSKYGPETVVILRNMIARHYDGDHRFLCVTDTPQDLPKDIETVPDFGDFANIDSPHGAHQPSCYRRLRAFHPDIGAVFGERFVSLDLDTVIVGPLRPLFDRPEDFVGWGDVNPRSWLNGSMFLLRAGTRPQVWNDFDPKTSPRLAKVAGRMGSDQAWLSYCLGKHEAMWSTTDGVYSFRVHIAPRPDVLPSNARVVHFHGRLDPWLPAAKQIGWIREAYQ